MNEEEIFADALEIVDAQERNAFLEEACAGDLELKRSVKKLLAFSDSDDDFLETPALGLDEPVDAMQPGATIGRYRLIERIGEGGFGEVWRAEQEEPVRRIVAVKVIKPGMDTRQVIARFEAERQALAMMSHRNIAAVLDAGSTDRGRPYFVMEFVDGKSIDAFCDHQRLSVAERLKLFAQICRAVHHAHQKGIVHRDIKPSNIIVAKGDVGADARVIDFGIAKAIANPIGQDVTATGPRQLVGTPEYMSPEQMCGDLDIDTRTDVYALGGVLYKLLVGVAPLDAIGLRRRGFDELARAIREDDAPRPSSRLLSLEQAESIAELRATKPVSLSRLLRGELDWIVAKSLAKERARRYGSASELARDVERFLACEPVAAGPPSLAYRSRKFVQRNTVSVLAALMLTVGVCVTATLATFSYFEIQAERDRTYGEWMRAESEKRDADRLRRVAEEQSETALRMMETLDELLQQASPENANPSDQSLRKPLDQFAATLSEQLEGNPVAEAKFRQTVGKIYKVLHDAKKAGIHLEIALQLREQHLGEQHADTIHSMVQWGQWLYSQSRIDEAAAAIETALKTLREGSPNSDLVDALDMLFKIRRLQGSFAESRGLLDEAWQTSLRVHGEDHPRTIRFQGALAMQKLRQRDLDGAELLARDAVTRMQRVLPDSHIGVAMAKHYLSRVLIPVGKLEEAETLIRESMQTHERVFGEENVVVVSDLVTLAKICRADQRFEEALDVARQAVQRAESADQESGNSRFEAYDLLATMLRQTDPNAAIDVRLQAIDARRRIAPNHPELLTEMRQVAVQLRRMRRWDEGEALYRQLLDWLAEHSEDAAPTRRTIHDFADLLREAGKTDEAIRYLQSIGDPSGSALPMGVIDLMELLLETDRVEEAQRLARKLEAAGSDHAFLACAAGVAKAQLLLAQSEFGACQVKLQETLSELQASGTNLRLVDRVVHAMIDCEIAQKKFRSAEQALLRSFNKSRGRGFFPIDRRRTVLKLVRLYEAWGKEERADSWREKLSPTFTQNGG